jgi:hypothetical protein
MDFMGAAGAWLKTTPESEIPAGLREMLTEIGERGVVSPGGEISRFDAERMNTVLMEDVGIGPDAYENFIKLMDVWVGNKSGNNVYYSPTSLLVKAVMDRFMKAAGYESVGFDDVRLETSNGPETVAGWSAVRQDVYKNIKEIEKKNFWNLLRK